jgi:hypothetical protein
MNDEENRRALDLEMRQRAAAPRQLPTPGIDATGNASMYGEAPVVVVTEEDIRRYGSGGHVCGECKHFELGHGQAAMAAQKFIPKLVREYEWKYEHFFLSPSNEMGLCGERGDTLTGVMHAACPHFTPHNGKLKREAKTSELEAIAMSKPDARRMQERRIRDWRTSLGLDKPPVVER